MNYKENKMSKSMTQITLVEHTNGYSVGIFLNGQEFKDEICETKSCALSVISTWLDHQLRELKPHQCGER